MLPNHGLCRRDHLQRYAFPGNVRELEHIIERAVLQACGRAITPDLVTIGEASIGTGKASSVEKLLDLPYHKSVQAWERLLIDRALEAADGNKAEAARRLGVRLRIGATISNDSDDFGQAIHLEVSFGFSPLGSRDVP